MPSVAELRTTKDSDFASDLDEIAREGARRLLAQALEAEVADYIARNQERNESGRAQVVRNGRARPRKVTVGSGAIEVQAPRVDDRRRGEDGSRQTFRHVILFQEDRFASLHGVAAFAKLRGETDKALTGVLIEHGERIHDQLIVSVEEEGPAVGEGAQSHVSR